MAQISQEIPVLESCFNKVAITILLKRDSNTGAFL